MTVLSVYRAKIAINGYRLLQTGRDLSYVDRSERIILVACSKAMYWTEWNPRFVKIPSAQFNPETHGQLRLPGF